MPAAAGTTAPKPPRRSSEQQAAWNALSPEERRRQNQAQATRQGSGTPAAPKPPPFAGQSQETGEVRRRAMEELPADNRDMYEDAERFSRDLLAGDTRNPLLDRATTAADDIAVDPRLERSPAR
jgi:hypothetical protein